MLTENKKENYRELQETFINNISVQLAIMEYRKQQINKGRGQDIIVKDLQEVNNIELKEMLQKLFLEPIPQEHFNYIIEKLNQTEKGLQKLYNRHLEDKNIRILSIVLTL